MLNVEHRNWINHWKQTNGAVTNRCHEVSFNFVKAFPLLRLCKGWIHLRLKPSAPFVCQYPDHPLVNIVQQCWHWWTNDCGSIVDPTAEQYDQFDILDYEEYDLHRHGNLPVSKCRWCGILLSNDKRLCEPSSVCAKYVASIPKVL